jgi:hypothetical protein
VPPEGKRIPKEMKGVELYSWREAAGVTLSVPKWKATK